MSMRVRFVGAVASLAVASALPGQGFSAGIPSGWTCIGTCGTLGANGAVPLAPGGGTQYGYVVTTNGESGIALQGVGGSGFPTTGSELRSAVFTANAGDVLNFSFDYVTSDGGTFADYAWARLLDPALNQVAILFTARTAPSGSIIPGFSMPAPAATLNPASVPITGGCTTGFGNCDATDWSPLGGDSRDCFAVGCGNTGWITALFTIAATGSYILEFGTTNWNDQAFQSGMAFDGLKLNDVPINDVVSATPEPGTLTLMGTGVFLLWGVATRRRKTKSQA